MRLIRLLRPRTRAPRQPEQFVWSATAVVLLPDHYTQHAPVWRPGAQLVELNTSRLWARREPGGLLHVLTVEDRAGAAALVRGDVSASHALQLHHSPDTAARLRELARPGSLIEKPLRYPHPAVRYRSWCDTVQKIAACNAQLAGLPGRTYDGIDLTRSRDTSFQLVMRVTAWRESEVDRILRALLQLSAFYKPGGQLRLHPAAAGVSITDPVRAAALNSLRLNDIETLDGPSHTR